MNNYYRIMLGRKSAHAAECFAGGFVGQVLRYMGFIKEQVAEADQTVEGAIIALDDDQKMRWALLSVPSISFYRYQISFKLVKG